MVSYDEQWTSKILYVFDRLCFILERGFICHGPYHSWRLAGRMRHSMLGVLFLAISMLLRDFTEEHAICCGRKVAAVGFTLGVHTIDTPRF
jgi:hypothetical protein